MSYNTFTPIVTNGLVLYLDAANTKSYPGTGTSWLDLSKVGSNSTLVSSPVFTSSNGNGNFTFNGTNNYVSLPIYSYGTGNYTWSFWLKCNAHAGAFISQGQYALNTGGAFTCAVRNDLNGLTNAVTLGIATDYGASPPKYKTILSSSNIYTNSVWFHYTATWNYTTKDMFIYINGTKISTTVVSTSGVDLNGSLTPNNTSGRVQSIGTYDDQRIGTFQYNGSISSGMIYNRQLSDSEVLQNYNATKYRFQ
jgi:hypothetical protein